MNLLSRECTYSGTSLLHGIHRFWAGSKWKSYRVGS